MPHDPECRSNLLGQTLELASYESYFNEGVGKGMECCLGPCIEFVSPSLYPNEEESQFLNHLLNKLWPKVTVTCLKSNLKERKRPNPIRL